MSLQLESVTIDTTDATALGAWWAERFGAETIATNNGWFVTIRGGGLPGHMSFQKVEDPTPGKNRLHIDLTTSEPLAQVVAALVAAGAGVVEERSAGTFEWVTLTDPDGNEFCVAEHRAAASEYQPE